MIPVFICSPYSGDVENNVKYAKELCLKAATKGYAPYAPHLLCTQFLNDDIPAHRSMGIKIGLAYMDLVDEVWVCSDTITKGMEQEIKCAGENDIRIRYYHELKEARLI